LSKIRSLKLILDPPRPQLSDDPIDIGDGRIDRGQGAGIAPLQLVEQGLDLAAAACQLGFEPLVRHRTPDRAPDELANRYAGPAGPQRELGLLARRHQDDDASGGSGQGDLLTMHIAL
jgi:hypothetical protein